MVLYHGEELKFIPACNNVQHKDFFYDDALWIQTPDQRSLPYMMFVGGFPDEWCVGLKYLPKDELNQLLSDNPKNHGLAAAINKTLRRPEALCNLGYIMAPKSLVEVQHKRNAIRYAYREQPDNEQDSGWRVFHGDESDEYINSPNNIGIYHYSTIVNIDFEIMRYLSLPVGTTIERRPYVWHDHEIRYGSFCINQGLYEMFHSIILDQGRQDLNDAAGNLSIENFESAYHIALPEQYKKWLCFSDGGELFHPVDVQLYGVAHEPIIDVHDSDRPDDSYIVIGRLASGDTIVFKNGQEQISIFNIEGNRIEKDEIYDNFYTFLKDLNNLVGD